MPKPKFYRDEPKAPEKKIAKHAPIPSPVLGIRAPSIVPPKPAKVLSFGTPHKFKPPRKVGHRLGRR